MQTLNSQDIETFRDQGFLIIRKLFAADDIALLCHAFDYTLTLAARPDLPEDIPVSYTHLTLPTICSV